MKYAKLEVLSDTPLRKFLYLRIDAENPGQAGSKITQICNVSLAHMPNAPRSLITVVVKGAQLSYNVIQEIVQDYLSGNLQLQPGFRISIREE